MGNNLSLVWSYLSRVALDIVNNKYMEFLPCLREHILDLILHFLMYKNSKESRQYTTKKDINICVTTFHAIIVKYARNNLILVKILWGFH